MSVIYKISCKDLNVKECYFGSTKDFDKRKIKHKSACCKENRKEYNFPVYKFIRSNGGWDNWSINIIEEIDSGEKEIYQKCERKYIEENREIALNKGLPGRTPKEYKQDNTEKIKEKAKERYQNNKEKISEYHKERYQENNEKIKEYRENNKEKIKQRQKDYYKKNKDEINRKAREKYNNKKNDSK